MYNVQVWIEHPVKTLDRTFTYISDENIERGARVSVPFGNTKILGFVESCKETEKTLEELKAELGYSVKKIDTIIDSESLLTDELHDLALQMRNDTLSTAIACFCVMLPSKIRPQGKVKSVVQERWVKPTNLQISLTKKQEEALQYVKASGKLLYSVLRNQYPAIAPILIKKGVLEVYYLERQAVFNAHVTYKTSRQLTPLQQSIIDEIHASNDSIYLLRGVTGAGKTEVYLRLAKEALDNHHQVLFLVPEIGLTPQMIERVQERFGSELAIYHSGLSDQEKYEQYRKVKDNQARIVVGTRSAIFLPFLDLGLIVMDEEHDPSYKQDHGVCYHCRDIALYRGKYHHCKVILGSATPSLESYARATKNVYHLLEMNERISKALPEVSIVDMKTMLDANDLILSKQLKEKMQDRFDHHERIILLLNRRGYHAQLRCRDCGEVIMCPHCDLALSYHRQENILKCHNCGTYMMIPKECPSCHSEHGFMSYGFGTERLEKEVQTYFPEAKTLRMDADTTTRKNSHQKLLEAFSNGKANVLLGTQMIAKGLDFPDVTLVGIINGDNGLARQDFRSCEMTFDLLMQAAGRSGRGDRHGEVIFQVFNPEHYAIQDAAKQDYISFYKNEMHYRHIGQYPPFTYIVSLLIRHRNADRVDEIASWLMQNMQGIGNIIPPVKLNKLSDFYRTRIIVRSKNLDELRDRIRQVLALDPRDYRNSILVDVNPLTLD